MLDPGLFLSAAKKGSVWTEGAFVILSWFWLVELPAHISSLCCENTPGTDPHTLLKLPPHRHGRDDAKLSASFPPGLSRPHCRNGPSWKMLAQKWKVTYSCTLQESASRNELETTFLEHNSEIQWCLADRLTLRTINTLQYKEISHQW